MSGHFKGPRINKLLRSLTFEEIHSHVLPVNSEKFGLYKLAVEQCLVISDQERKNSSMPKLNKIIMNFPEAINPIVYGIFRFVQLREGGLFGPHLRKHS